MSSNSEKDNKYVTDRLAWGGILFAVFIIAMLGLANRSSVSMCLEKKISTDGFLGGGPENKSAPLLFDVSANCVQFNVILKGTLIKPYTVVWDEARIKTSLGEYYALVNPPIDDLPFITSERKGLVCENKSGQDICGASKSFRKQFTVPTVVKPDQKITLIVGRYYPIIFNKGKGAGPPILGSLFDIKYGPSATLIIPFKYGEMKYRAEFRFKAL